MFIITEEEQNKLNFLKKMYMISGYAEVSISDGVMHFFGSHADEDLRNYARETHEEVRRLGREHYDRVMRFGRVSEL